MNRQELNVREFTRLPLSTTQHLIIRLFSQPLYSYSFVPDYRTVEVVPTSKSKFPYGEVSWSTYSFRVAYYGSESCDGEFGAGAVWSTVSTST